MLGTSKHYVEEHRRNLAVEMLKIVMKKADIFSLATQVAFFVQESAAAIIEAFSVINNLLSSIDISALNTIVLTLLLQFAISMSGHSDRDVRYHAAKALIYLSNSGGSDAAMDCLIEMMKNEHPEVKAEIIRRIKRANTKSPKAAAILQQGREDFSWAIRRIASNPLQE